MWSSLFLLFLTTAGLVAADCDKDACNIGISAGVGAADVCSLLSLASFVEHPLVLAVLCHLDAESLEQWP